jgi:hypothetical protein
MKEIWKDIFGYEGYYQISSFGRLKALPRKIITKNGVIRCYKERIRDIYAKQTGYYGTPLNRDNGKKYILVHRLVAETFIPNPDNKPEINHIDGNKMNNNFANLEWVTSKENHLHAQRIGLKKHWTGINNPNNKLTMNNVSRIRQLYSSGLYTQQNLADSYRIDQTTISDIVNNKIWA